MEWNLILVEEILRSAAFPGHAVFAAAAAAASYTHCQSCTAYRPSRSPREHNLSLISSLACNLMKFQECPGYIQGLVVVVAVVAGWMAVWPGHRLGFLD